MQLLSRDSGGPVDQKPQVMIPISIAYKIYAISCILTYRKSSILSWTSIILDPKLLRLVLVVSWKVLDFRDMGWYQTSVGCTTTFYFYISQMLMGHVPVCTTGCFIKNAPPFYKYLIIPFSYLFFEIFSNQLIKQSTCKTLVCCYKSLWLQKW